MAADHSTPYETFLMRGMSGMVSGMPNQGSKVFVPLETALAFLEQSTK